MVFFTVVKIGFLGISFPSAIILLTLICVFKKEKEEKLFAYNLG